MKRLRPLHHLLSAAVVLLALYWVATRIDPGETWARLRAADFRWFALGFVVFFASLPLRAWRWRVLLDAVQSPVPVPRLVAIIFRAWTINCAIPGRAGDLYGAYALHEETRVEGSRALGTIVTARVLDVLVLVALIGGMFALDFHARFPATMRTAVFWALGLGAALLAAFALLRRSGPLGARLLPARLAGLWDRFLGAVFGSLADLPRLLPLTAALWLLEGARLWCVLRAIGEAPPLAPVMFLALAAAVLTTLPLTPGGLGTVEALYQQFLPALGVGASAAATAAILDRVINYWFILLAGAVYFLVRGGRAAARNDRTKEADEQ